MAASILFEAPIALSNVPHLRDVQTMASLLEHMGANCVWNGREGLSIAAGSLAETQAPYHLVRTMRASFNVLGPLLARYGQAEVSLPVVVRLVRGPLISTYWAGCWCLSHD